MRRFLRQTGVLVIALLLSRLIPFPAFPSGTLNEAFTRPLFQFFSGSPAEAFYRYSVIKSIQRGVITWSSAASATATLSPAVVTANTRVVLLGWYNSGQDWVSLQPWVTLTDTTTVTATRFSTSANSTAASWETLEYFPGIVKSIQRGTVVLDSNPKNTTITAVVMAKATVDHLGWGINTDGPSVSYSSTYFALTTTTNLQNYGGSTGSQTSGYQVTEFK
jgi:hypothetical protein